MNRINGKSVAFFLLVIAVWLLFTLGPAPSIAQTVRVAIGAASVATLPTWVAVHLPHEGGVAAILAISVKKDHPAQPMHAMWAAWCVYPSLGKITVVVDDDIDVRDMFELQWAMSFRVQPAKDVQIVPVSPVLALDPSIAPEDVPQQVKGKMTSSKVAIDATKKHKYPALALPPKEHLLKADAKWDAYGLE